MSLCFMRGAIVAVAVSTVVRQWVQQSDGRLNSKKNRHVHDVWPFSEWRVQYSESRSLQKYFTLLFNFFQTSHNTCLLQLHPTGGSCVMIFFTDSGHRGIFVVEREYCSLYLVRSRWIWRYATINYGWRVYYFAMIRLLLECLFPKRNKCKEPAYL